MKIALVADYFLADMGYPKISLANAWQAHGHTVRVICSDRYFPFHNYDHTVKKLIGTRFREKGIKKEKGVLVERKPVVFELFARTYFTGLQASLNKYKPDVVVVFGISSFSAIQVALRKMIFRDKTKVIMVDSHLPSELALGNQLFKKIFYGAFRLLWSSLISTCTTRFIATQDKTVDLIRDVYGIRRPITLIPNGTDTELFKKSPEVRKSIRQKYSIQSKDFVVLYTGKVIPEKGVAILFKAFALLNKTHQDCWLMIVGDGSPEYKKVCEFALSEDLRKKVIWVDYQKQSELYKYYSAADVAVWPLQESLAMNDAASCEVPFIANHTLGDKTRISNHNALLYKKGDSLDLAKKINLLHGNKALRQRMGENGRQLVEKKLSWKRLAELYLKYYAQ